MKPEPVETQTTEENSTPKQNSATKVQSTHSEIKTESSFLDLLPSELRSGHEQFMRSARSSNEAYKYIIRPMKQIKCPYKE